MPVTFFFPSSFLAMHMVFDSRFGYIELVSLYHLPFLVPSHSTWSWGIMSLVLLLLHSTFITFSIMNWILIWVLAKHCHSGLLYSGRRNVGHITLLLILISCYSIIEKIFVDFTQWALKFQFYCRHWRTWQNVYEIFMTVCTACIVVLLLKTKITLGRQIF